MAKSKSKTEVKTETKAKGKVAQKAATLVRKKILDAQKAKESSALVLAELLSEAYHKEYFIQWGFDEWPDYCDQELDVHYRKAMYMVDIWDKLVEFDLDPKEAAKLGWTKMKEISSIITKRNAEGLMQKAGEMSSREFTEKVVKKVRQARGTDRKPITTSMKLVLNEDEASVILEAIKEAKKLTESDNDVVALEMICQDWMEDKGAVPEATSLEARITFMEKAYGVKLEVKGKKAKPKAKAETTAETTAEAKAETKAGKKASKGKATAKGKGKAAEKSEGAEEQDIDDILGL